MTSKSGKIFVSVLVGLIYAIPGVAAAEPNENSVATVQACLESTENVFVCSSKALSNVIVHCQNAEGSSFIKYDDLDDPESAGAGYLDSAYQGTFPCPEGSTVLSVFTKSGSARYSGEPQDDLPNGAGAVFFPAECPIECPAPGAEDDAEEVEEVEGEEEVVE